MVTVLTVGYGDMAPTSVAGKLIATILMFFSVLVMALPITIIGSSFSNSWVRAPSIGCGARNTELWLVPRQPELFWVSAVQWGPNNERRNRALTNTRVGGGDAQMAYKDELKLSKRKETLPR